MTPHSTLFKQKIRPFMPIKHNYIFGGNNDGFELVDEEDESEMMLDFLFNFLVFRLSPSFAFSVSSPGSRMRTMKPSHNFLSDLSLFNVQ